MFTLKKSIAPENEKSQFNMLLVEWFRTITSRQVQFGKKLSQDIVRFYMYTYQQIDAINFENIHYDDAHGWRRLAWVQPQRTTISRAWRSPWRARSNPQSLDLVHRLVRGSEGNPRVWWTLIWFGPWKAGAWDWRNTRHIKANTYVYVLENMVKARQIMKTG